MKVVTFERKGARSYGILEDDRVLDVGSRLASRYGDLRSVLTAGALRELQSAGAQGVPTFRVDEVNFEPVIPNPEKILCVGLNYEAIGPKRNDQRLSILPFLPALLTLRSGMRPQYCAQASRRRSTTRGSSRLS